MLESMRYGDVMMKQSLGKVNSYTLNCLNNKLKT